MGLDSNSCRLLLLAKRRGADFTRTLTLGRLNLSLSQTAMRSALTEFGMFRDNEQVSRIFSDPNGFCEPFLKELGATKVDSVDATDYEGATFTCDLNNDLPTEMLSRYDAVVDGGTLEHVFNFPNALRNAMQCVNPGGRLFIVTQCNNAMGHGFYQFSPELYFRAFGPENGYSVNDMFIAEGSFGRVPWHSVNDPKEIRCRVELVNDVQTFLMVSATRERETAIFSKWPQQSDYSLAWKEGTPDPNFKQIVDSSFDMRDHLPAPFKRLVRWIRILTRPRFNAPCYSPADPASLAASAERK